MKHILLATDLGPNSDRALERALKIAKEQRATLHILHALPIYASRDYADNRAREARDLIDGYVNEYKDKVGTKIKIHIEEDMDVHLAVLEYSRKVGADLIVMGMHSKGRLADMFIGTTLERVTRKSLKPILMVSRKPTGPYQSILAATDFAPTSRNALRLAMDLYPAAAFEVIHTYMLPIVYPSTAAISVEIQDNTEKHERRFMDAFIITEKAHFKKTHNGDEKRLKHKLVEDFPFDAIEKEAKAVKADLLTIGVHGGSMLLPLKIGGVAAELLDKPPCDILLVKE